jgi:hypothetical protein
LLLVIHLAVRRHPELNMLHNPDSSMIMNATHRS